MILGASYISIALSPTPANAFAVTSAHAEQSLADKTHEQVNALAQAYKRLQRVVDAGGWPRVSSRTVLAYGDQSPHVNMLRKRLNLPKLVRGNDIYGQRVRSAVSAYQRFHGLDSDGIAGPQTLAHLNVTAQDRLAQIAVNIQRWEGLKIGEDDRLLWVNIPEFALRLFAQDQEVLSMRVIVGNKANPTPEMFEQLEYLVFNPYWHVPRRISAQEILPKVQQNPAYLHQEKFDVLNAGEIVNPTNINWNGIGATELNYRFRQQPGPKNALGTVKFIFPNPEAVYLHDTPSKTLFSRTSRAFSHGCVRVEDPNMLATAVLSLQNGLSKSEIDQHLNSRKTRRVVLDEDMPVRLTYITAQAKGGQVQFFNDLYNRDPKSRGQGPIPASLVQALANPLR